MAVTTGPVNLSGYFTSLNYLQGKTLAEIERLVGYDAGRLKQGAWFATPITLPGINDFDLAGYSQVADHRAKAQYGDMNKPANKSEQDAFIIKKKNAMSQWSLIGAQRLVKVIPMTGHSYQMSDDYQYPPGAGIPQWKVKRERSVLCRGICYVGNYPNGIFIAD
jgi:hypothetical protein